VENGKRWLAVRSAGLEGMASGAAAKQRVLIIRDITTQREMEREREEARRLIALAEMSSILAHEIRNPLGSMELFTGLLTESENLNDEQRGWAEHLQHGVRSLSATVNNVLQVHSSGAASRTPVMLAPILREAKSFLAPLAERADVAFSLAEQLSDAKIEGNAGELQQLIVNLALNAFQHTAAGGRTMLKATRQAGMSGEVARIELSDTGCGIPTPYLERIFEAGFTTRERSPGLGLAVCRSIVRQHRGLMTVHSQLGKGTTFRMEFPLL
jgi:signal transduction histidine kinase